MPVHDLASSPAVDPTREGTGELLEVEPHLTGTVVELPSVVGRAVRHPRLEVVEVTPSTECPRDTTTTSS